MATWVVHLRIADYFLNRFNIDKREFVLGNVAPDCGYGAKDSFGEFVPPPRVTHWSPTGTKQDCRYKDFCATYMKDIDKTSTEYSFYLGYYVHLLTDIMWSREFFAPTKKKYAEQYEKDPDFLLTIKKDWNDLDFLYLDEHPDFEAYKILMSVDKVNDYLSYYEKGQLTEQIGFIADYYKNGFKDHNFKRKYNYLTANDVNNFVTCAEELICMEMKYKKLV